MERELSEFNDLHDFLTIEMGLIPEPEHGGTWRTYFYKKVIWHPSQTTRTIKVLFDQFRIPLKIQLCVSSDNNNSVFVQAPFETCTLTRIIKNEVAQLYIFDVATEKDLPEIVRMKLLMFTEAGHADLLAENASEVILADYQRLYAESLARHFVAKFGATIVGCAGAFLKDDLPFRYFKTSRYGFIGDVYTDTANRGRGIASRLSADALAWLRSHDIGMIRLLASDAGRPIYRRLEFTLSDEMVLINRAH